MRWAVLLLLSALLAFVFEQFHIPAGLLLGPMLAAILLAGFEKQVDVPPIVSLLAQAVIGCMIANSIPADILRELMLDWHLLAAGVSLRSSPAACALGWLLARLKVLPGSTAIWGSFPGAASAMTIMAGAYGADMRLVAFMQYLRVVCVSAVASVIAVLWIGKPAAAAHAVTWFPPVDRAALAGTLALVVGSLAVVWLLKRRSLIFILPMIGGMVLQGRGLMTIELPPWLLAASYALVGWTIGSRFARRPRPCRARLAARARLHSDVDGDLRPVRGGPGLFRRHRSADGLSRHQSRRRQLRRDHFRIIECPTYPSSWRCN